MTSLNYPCLLQLDYSLLQIKDVLHVANLLKQITSLLTGEQLGWNRLIGSNCGIAIICFYSLKSLFGECGNIGLRFF
ncbi:hypothetical protein C0J52_02190 [Blattella germanica]|nr:hypothetical protein C0J52_02190 [Blattella germanica]